MGFTPTSTWPCVVHVVSRLPHWTERPIQTRFRFGFTTEWLNLARDGKSPDHYAKGTPSPRVGSRQWAGSSRQEAAKNRVDSYCPLPTATANCRLPTRWAPTACRHVVSGSLSSPDRGSSHLSLALLGSLSVAREYLALRDGPRRFRLASTCRVLLRCRIVSFPLSRTGLSPALVELSRSFR